MKKIIVAVVAICCTMQLQLASAQSAELQQLSLDIEKLAQFKQILSDMKKGYDLLNTGYSTISNISHGNFSLHQTFLNGLLTVSPSLRTYSKVAQIISYQETLLAEYKSAYSNFKSGGRFTPEEITYMGMVYKNLFNQSINNLSTLAMVLTDTQLRMSDDERLRQIDGIDRDMQDKLSFLRSFNNKVSAIDSQREGEQRDSKKLQQLYDNNTQ